MNVSDFRLGNFVIYEACDHVIRGINLKKNNRGEEVAVFTVSAINHDWGEDTCGVEELKGLDLEPELLKKLGFVPLNKGLPDLWIKPLEGYRYIRYHSKVHYMEFESTHTFHRVPWAVRYLHQMQNAVTDYGLTLDLRP